MNVFLRWFVRVWCLVAVSGIVLRLLGIADGFPWRMLGWAMATLALLMVIASGWRERHRRNKDGYYVDSRGGAEDGSVAYHENGRTLELYFTRDQDLIYVPSDAKWNEIMPSWAQNRKQEIMGRIKSQFGQRWIGRNWSYVETDSPELLMVRSQPTK